MALYRVAAFCDGPAGGNPAGVHLSDRLPEPAQMQHIAAGLGFSETAFAAPEGDGWRVRYFAPTVEVPFCGHATIALGAMLAREVREGVHALQLNAQAITVEAHRDGERMQAALQSPPTRSARLPPARVTDVLALFGWQSGQLDPRLPPAHVHAGADHLLLAVRDRATLAAMRYDFEAGRRLMKDAGCLTIALVHAESDQRFHCRNAFAAGGVYEDPATGAAAAAFAGYLRDIGWPHAGAIDLVQGEDMGRRSLLHARIDPPAGSSIRVSGGARLMAPDEA
ncbi:PhzF family phenazine biosynthesis protein [Arenimonas sp. MALMAid1274]|uniref:PhzF family phenazine biosynthesis protein n=1 Tax=Arenimonas sp. MALMAid1274 TaxID=3411630 RepID=UPI003B9FEB90